ncbi:MAG: autotransporter outer membrane beta-barrel domain-containing protein, partial [Glutamicibacter sp.]
RQRGNSDMLGFDADANALQVGGQLPLTDALALTGSLAYESSTFTDDAARVNGDALVGGLGLLYATGPWELSAGIDTADGNYHSRRQIGIGGQSDTVTARPKQTQYGAHLRAAYAVPVGEQSFVRPYLEGHAIHVSDKAFVEQGDSPFRLAVNAQSDTAYIGVAGVEAGSHLQLRNGMALRPFIGAAVEYGNVRRWTTSARFADQADGAPFNVDTAGPDTLGRVNIGADLLGSKNVTFSLQYGAEFGKGYTSHTGTARLAVSF